MIPLVVCVSSMGESEGDQYHSVVREKKIRQAKLDYKDSLSENSERASTRHAL